MNELDRRREILGEIGIERGTQVLEHGYGPAHDAEHTRNDWVAYICAYAGRGTDCYHNGGETFGFRSRMIRVAALAVAAVEAVDRGDLRS